MVAVMSDETWNALRRRVDLTQVRFEEDGEKARAPLTREEVLDVVQLVQEIDRRLG